MYGAGQNKGNGNRTNGGFTPGVNNRLTANSIYNYKYDNEGNLTKRTKISDGTYTDYAWDHRNRLVKVTIKNASNQELNRVEYRYDADDHLVGRKMFLNGSSTPSEQRVFAYDQGQVALQFDRTASGNITTSNLNHRYLWGAAVDQLLADEDVNVVTSPGTVLWPLTDHLGTVRDWLNNSATNVDHVEYDTYGKRLDTPNPAIDVAFGWTGRYRDALTGLLYNNARWYDPAIGRWMSDEIIRDCITNTPTGLSHTSATSRRCTSISVTAAP